jgi:hypothetical protein
MVQTASHLVENVLPRLPFRQFVMSFPMRIRHYLETHQILQIILKIVVDEIRKTLISCSPNVSNPQIGAISFIQYFGNTLNYHPHFHLVVADGIFSDEQGLLFHEATLTPDDVEDTQEHIQRRVLRYFYKRGFFDKDEVEKMLAYENSGFSLNANVKIESFDKTGLERLIRYCARPPFASENLRWSGKLLIYRFPKPSHTGKTYVQLDPLDFIDRISKFIPYPRRHRHHFHGAFAPSSPLRTQVVANAQKKPENTSQAMQEAIQKIKKASRTWAKLISRIYEVDPLICSSCGKKIKIISFVTHPEQIRRILKGIGWPIIIPEFEPPYELTIDNICQLFPTPDGFPEFVEQIHYNNYGRENSHHYDTGPDPPYVEEIDPPHRENICDPPHWSY